MIILPIETSEWYPVYSIYESIYSKKISVSLEDAGKLKKLMDIRDKAQEEIYSILEKYGL